ncbi:hypothetical protein B0T14DRAFT_565670 [Immersiella caudata]|uniref:Uncharacterized protein n=1 Tax=Immersiella caudata TaxID=314043 RepID=A0AA40C4F6_9PEZI|nr:hypothetical protein B0T14DRAFT_565670 [Immersiella caudata]
MKSLHPSKQRSRKRMGSLATTNRLMPPKPARTMFDSLAGTLYSHTFNDTRDIIDEFVYSIRSCAGRNSIVLVGLDNVVDSFMRARPDLAALFPCEIAFENLTVEESLTLLDQRLRGEGVSCPAFASKVKQKQFLRALEIAPGLACWSNATDLDHIVNMSIRKTDAELWSEGTYENGVSCLPDDISMAAIKALLKTKTERSRAAGAGPRS